MNEIKFTFNKALHIAAMQIVKIKKGFCLNLAGLPKATLTTRPLGLYAGVDLRGLADMKPKLAVTTGQKVQQGELLFYAKDNPALKFMAPAAGEIVEIAYGPKRALRQIVIKRDAQGQAVNFPVLDETALAALPREEVVNHIAAGGLWYLLRELPFRQPANMAATPPRIYVALDSLEPGRPDPKVYLEGNEALFAYGLNVLRKLCPEPPVLIVAAQNTALAERFPNEKLIGFNGRYPAHDPGVILYRTKKTAAENHAWFIDGQDLLHIAGLLRNGAYPTHRIYAVGGVPVKTGHVKAPLGCSVADITGFSGRDHWRVLAGSVFKGRVTEPTAYAGPLDKAFFVINDGARQGRFVAWMLFGVKTTSSFKAHLSSWLPKRKRALNCNMHGGLRSCIACNQCARLCPVDIWPSLTWKALLAGEVEEALSHGLLDCVECGLCSYGCPSKIELSEAFITARADFYKESAI